MNISTMMTKIHDADFMDVFPLNNKVCTVKNMLEAVGIYLAALLVSVMLLLLLGGVFILGIIIKIVCIPVSVYSAVGMTAWLMRYMKLN